MAYFLLIFIPTVVFVSVLALYKNKVKNKVSRNGLVHSASTQSFGLGTVIQITAYGKNADEAIDEAVNTIGDIDDKMSYFKTESDICRINANAGLSFQNVSEETYYVIKQAVYYSELSNGAIDLTVRPALNLWGIGSDNVKIPDKKLIEDTLKLVNYKDIECNDDNKAIMLKKKGQSIDVNCIAKGFAADEVKRVLEKHNIKSAMINLGGNVLAHGCNPDGLPWRVGIQSPKAQRGKYIGFLNVKNKSVVTSGDYEKFFMYNGEKYHHIINPKTGYPVKNKIISTTIISEYSIDGDALTTCLYVMGVEKGLKFMQYVGNIDAIIITEENKVYGTDNMKKYFTITDEEFSWGN